MAGDWIKMRASLCTHPKVGLIAEIIGESTEIGKRLSTGFKGCLDEIVTRDVTRDITIASLLRVWCATNEHTRDGVWEQSTLRSIDVAAGIQGFGEAMEIAGWLVVDEEAGTVTMPNFLEYNSPAKGGARTPGAARQQKYRENQKKKRDANGDVTRDVTVTPREEKRREERNTPKAPKGADPDGFAEFWPEYPNHAAKAKAVTAWAKIPAELHSEIMEALSVQKRSTAWTKDEGQFVPHAATWLNGRRWEDRPATVRHQADAFAGAL
jgi:hypothetical protein